MIPAWALTALLNVGALIDVVHGGDLVECEPQRVTGHGRHWAYRIIDGRECWYPGQPGKPKDQLFWGHSIATPSARQTVDQTAVEAETESSEPQPGLAATPLEEPKTIDAMPEEWRAAAADQLLAFTCCWPELNEPAPVPQPRPKEKQDQPPAWPLALLPLALGALWWLLKPRRGPAKTAS